MIKFFEDYCNRLFPSIDTSVKNSVLDAIKQIDMTKTPWFMNNLLEEISQGDILDRIPFNIIQDDGSVVTYMTKGLILSNTCDLQRDPYIVIAPLFNIDGSEFNASQIETIKNNMYSEKIGFKNSYLDNYFVDLSKSMSFNRKVIVKAIEKNKIKREKSLSQFAAYMLYIKLTIYYMRIENHEHFEKRDRGI
jgi:hypothetical protein